MAKEFTMEEVGAHDKADDMWIAVDGKVYDVTKFAKTHPGGVGILRAFAGKECTEQFYEYHKAEVLEKFGKRLDKGNVKGAKEPGGLLARADKRRIDVVPYSEPSAWLGWKSPYYKESHMNYRLKLRAFVEDVLRPEANENEELGEYPTLEVYGEMGKCGLLASRIGKDIMGAVAKMPEIELEKQLGVKPEEFDHFHEQIAHEEVGRIGQPGYVDGLGAGHCIGLPPVLHFAAPAIRDKVIPEVLRGDKRICLAISEPAAGSDVAGMLTTAVKSADGTHYVVNGIKKWITNGGFADYFTTAVRTGKKGGNAFSMLFIPRELGVETKAIKTTYSASAGTALVLFDNVKVPVENLMGPGNVGKEGAGFACIMYNFNHERWFIVVQLMAACRTQIADCFKWSMQRKAFGKPLIEQAVVRNTLARMAGAVESAHAFIENVTYQMDTMPYKEQSVKLGGPIALLKYQCTRAATLVADCSTQIFGGRGITRTGMGQNTERFQKTYKYAAILGGSEEVLADLAIRQNLKDKNIVRARL